MSKKEEKLSDKNLLMKNLKSSITGIKKQIEGLELQRYVLEQRLKLLELDKIEIE